MIINITIMLIIVLYTNIMLIILTLFINLPVILIIDVNCVKYDI